jgi:hypothetical protein
MGIYTKRIKYHYPHLFRRKQNHEKSPAQLIFSTNLHPRRRDEQGKKKNSAPFRSQASDPRHAPSNERYPRMVDARVET